MQICWINGYANSYINRPLTAFTYFTAGNGQKCVATLFANVLHIFFNSHCTEIVRKVNNKLIFNHGKIKLLVVRLSAG